MSLHSDAHPNEPSKPEGPVARMLRMAMYGSLAVLVVLNLFIHPHEPHFVIDAWPGFWAVFGLIVAIGLTKIAKGAAHTFLGQEEDYYQQEAEEEATIPPMPDEHKGH